VKTQPSLYGIIMAGGVGSRFWPRSREKFPKQFLEIGQKGTMLQNTVRRLKGFIPDENIFIVTNKAQRSAVSKQLPHIPRENIIVEPLGRNTAPCIGLAAMFVHKIEPEGVMIVLPADHLVQDENEFLRVLGVGITAARKTSSLVTIGIKPTRPETGYGYIQFIEEKSKTNPDVESGVYRVKTFAEKPNVQIAQQFLESGDFLWNSGMFIWRAEVILNEIKKALPEMYEQLAEVKPSIGTPSFDQVLDHTYGVIRSISIDYGVMEKAKDVFVIKGEFGWNDVGSWDEVYRISEKDESGNHIDGKVISYNTKNSYIHTDDKLVATVGVDDVIVINTDDAVLVCKRGTSQDVKEVVDHLRRKQMNEFL
jgi:mannose-1-phosphate guanylyltransferase